MYSSFITYHYVITHVGETYPIPSHRLAASRQIETPGQKLAAQLLQAMEIAPGGWLVLTGQAKTTQCLVFAIPPTKL